MKKKIPEERKLKYSAISVPTELKVEFRKICIIQDIKPQEIVRKLLASWVEREKKKLSEPHARAVNG